LLYLVDDCAIDAARREVRRAGKLISVEPKVFDLVLYLLANRDRLVSKDELISVIWDGRTVSDAAISACIHSARIAISDRGMGQRLIKTFPRKGIRFIGVVSETPRLPPPRTRLGQKRKRCRYRINPRWRCCRSPA
jgi:DNA-binding winged helix-turn-helix (wHTH) protein